MATSASPDWRNVIRAYLDAQWEDHQRWHAASLQNCEARCLREFASEDVCRDYEEMIRHRMSVLETPPPESSYEVVQENEQRVVALVEMNRPQSKFRMQTQFALVRREAGWKIDAVSWPCFGCNPGGIRTHEGRPGPREGWCFSCGGSGKTMTASTQWRWFFRRVVSAPGPCPFCDGKGVCKRCNQSLVKGWVSVFHLEAELEKFQIP